MIRKCKHCFTDKDLHIIDNTNIAKEMFPDLYADPIENTIICKECFDWQMAPDISKNWFADAVVLRKL